MIKPITPVIIPVIISVWVAPSIIVLLIPKPMIKAPTTPIIQASTNPQLIGFGSFFGRDFLYIGIIQSNMINPTIAITIPVVNRFHSGISDMHIPIAKTNPPIVPKIIHPPL